MNCPPTFVFAIGMEQSAAPLSLGLGLCWERSIILELWINVFIVFLI